MRKGFKRHTGDKLNELPFVDRKELWVSEQHPDTVKLETFDCQLYDEQSGKCRDYGNRPDVCKKTTCGAFDTDEEEQQRQAIDEVRKEKFIICKK